MTRQPVDIHDVYVSRINALLADNRDQDAYELASQYGPERRANNRAQGRREPQHAAACVR